MWTLRKIEGKKFLLPVRLKIKKNRRELSRQIVKVEISLNLNVLSISKYTNIHMWWVGQYIHGCDQSQLNLWQQISTLFPLNVSSCIIINTFKPLFLFVNICSTPVCLKTTSKVFSDPLEGESGSVLCIGKTFSGKTCAASSVKTFPSLRPVKP